MASSINKSALEAFSSHIIGILDAHKRDRQQLEKKWIKYLRQYLGKYEPTIEKNIPEERSHVYPRDTRTKIKGGVAKLMEMMFPSQEKNFSIEPTPNPSIPVEALRAICDEAESQGLVGDQASTFIERKVNEFAQKRAENLEREIADQLEDSPIDYPSMCKRIVRSGFIYGFGVAFFPVTVKEKIRKWERNSDGVYEAKEIVLRRPSAEPVKIWNCFPDLSADSWHDQEFFFERKILMRSDLASLAKREDFLKGEIRDYLSNKPNGNYTPKSFDVELDSLASKDNISDRTTRRYELYRGVGLVSGAKLATVGVDLSEDQLLEDVFVEVWILDDRVIKIDKASFGERPSDQYHGYIYSDDEDSGITGVPLAYEIYDTQMSLCATTRALLDNMAAVAGPIYEVNTSLLPSRYKRNGVGSIHAFKVIEREGDGAEAQVPAVRSLHTESHIPEIIEIISMLRQQMDIESNMPAYTMGGMNQPLGEAFRTSNNMSMMMGSSNMVTKDTVRSFDEFTSSLIGAFVKWNAEFNDNIDIQGDFQVKAKGSMSLVAKEVRGAALDQFMTTLTPEERAMLDTYGVLIDRLKARDLPTDRVLPKEDADRILKSMQDASAAAASIEQGLTQSKTDLNTASANKLNTDSNLVSATAEATIREILSRVDANIARAKSDSDRTQLENLKVLLSTVQQKGASNE